MPQAGAQPNAALSRTPRIMARSGAMPALHQQQHQLLLPTSKSESLLASSPGVTNNDAADTGKFFWVTQVGVRVPGSSSVPHLQFAPAMPPATPRPSPRPRPHPLSPSPSPASSSASCYFMNANSSKLYRILRGSAIICLWLLAAASTYRHAGGCVCVCDCECLYVCAIRMIYAPLFNLMNPCASGDIQREDKRPIIKRKHAQ